MSPVRRFLASHPWAQYFLVAWVLAWSLAVALLITDRLSQSSREAARQQQQTAAFCTGIRSKAYAPLTDMSSEFARNDVRSAIGVYGLAGCADYTGELDPKRIDPEAFRPAPPPSSPRP